MVDHIYHALAGLPKDIIIIIIAALPVAELRVSIPIAIAMNISPLKALMLSLLGNMLPVIPTLILLEPISYRLRKFAIWRKFFDWLFEKTKQKADLIQKYEALGLMLFVTLPLPGTGAWSGCIAAALFKIKFRYAFLAILFGVIEAGLIVLLLSVCGKTILCAHH